MELIDEVYCSIDRYFSTLSHTGYKSYNEVYRLLIFAFIEELLYGPLSTYITEEDYKHISKSLDCIYGSCIISFPNYKKSFDSVVKRMPGEYRISEDDILRRTEDYELRVKS